MKNYSIDVVFDVACALDEMVHLRGSQVTQTMQAPVNHHDRFDITKQDCGSWYRPFSRAVSGTGRATKIRQDPSCA